MAAKRMLANAVIDDDRFLDMSKPAQLLYFHLAMKTDDDGFTIGPGRTARIIGATQEDFQELVDSGFLIEFPNRVYLLRHHKLNNDLKNDRYHPTVYQSEFSQVVETDKVYYPKDCAPSKVDTTCVQDGNTLETEPSVSSVSSVNNLKNPSYPGEGSAGGEDRVRGAGRRGQKTLEEVLEYADRMNLSEESKREAKEIYIKNGRSEEAWGFVTNRHKGIR